MNIIQMRQHRLHLKLVVTANYDEQLKKQPLREEPSNEMPKDNKKPKLRPMQELEEALVLGALDVALVLAELEEAEEEMTILELGDLV